MTNKELLMCDIFVHGLLSKLQQVVLNQKSNNCQEAVQAAMMAKAVRSTLGGGMQKKRLAFPTIGICFFTCTKKCNFAMNCPIKFGGCTGVSHLRRLRSERNLKCVCRTVQPGQWLSLWLNGCRLRMLVDAVSTFS